MRYRNDNTLPFVISGAGKGAFSNYRCWQACLDRDKHYYSPNILERPCKEPIIHASNGANNDTPNGISNGSGYGKYPGHNYVYPGYGPDYTGSIHTGYGQCIVLPEEPELPQVPHSWGTNRDGSGTGSGATGHRVSRYLGSSYYHEFVESI